MATVDLEALRRLHSLAGDAGCDLGILLDLGEQLADAVTNAERDTTLLNVRRQYDRFRETRDAYLSDNAAQIVVDAAMAGRLMQWGWPNGDCVYSAHAWIFVTVGMLANADPAEFTGGDFLEWIQSPETEQESPDDDDFVLPAPNEFRSMVDEALDTIDGEHLLAVRLLFQSGGRIHVPVGEGGELHKKAPRTDIPSAEDIALVRAICPDGESLTRDAVATRLRQSGHGMSNGKVSACLRHLKSAGRNRGRKD